VCHSSFINLLFIYLFLEKMGEGRCEQMEGQSYPKEKRKPVIYQCDLNYIDGMCLHVYAYWVNKKIGHLSERRGRNYPLCCPNVWFIYPSVICQ